LSGFRGDQSERGEQPIRADKKGLSSNESDDIGLPLQASQWNETHPFGVIS